MLGLRRGSVQLVPYTPAWATLFEAERARLQHALDRQALDIQHIGSTAVPGLAAKPILDLGVAVVDETIAMACVPRLAACGYTYRGYRGADQGHFFDLGPEHRLTHYLHVLRIDDPGWLNYLRFRDYLRAHPAARDAYQQLKHDLATRYAADRAAYSAAKATFIQHILTPDSCAAEEWYSAGSGNDRAAEGRNEADNGCHVRFCHPQRGSAPDAVQYEFSAKEYEYDHSRPGRKQVAHNLGRRLALSAQLDHYCYQSEGLALT